MGIGNEFDGIQTPPGVRNAPPPPAPPAVADKPRRSTARILVFVGIAVFLGIVAVGALLGYLANRANTAGEAYPDYVQDNFINSCETGNMTPSQCQCFLDGTMAEVSFTRYVEIENQVARTGALDPTLTRIAEGCAATP